MKQYRVASLFLACIALSTGTAHAQTALEMESKCRKLANTQTAEDGRIVMPPDRDSSECWAAFMTLQQLAVIAYDNGRRYLNVCAPAESTRLQYIKLFTNYASKHPEHLHRSFGLVALMALHEAFPCDREGR